MPRGVYNPVEKNCEDCGIIYLRTHNSRKTCGFCQSIRTRVEKSQRVARLKEHREVIRLSRACQDCGVSLADSYKNSKRCIACAELVRRRRCKANAVAIKGSTWTEELYSQRLDEQGGLCAICGQKCNTHASLSRDHNHETGEARGLLCMKCNTAIGKFGDSIELLESAIAYLRKYQ